MLRTASLTSLMLLHWLLLISSCWVEASQASVTNWQLTKDDPQEYSMQSSFPAADVHVCLARASVSGDAAAVTYDAVEGVCKQFKCLWGASGCRKCRNVNSGAGKTFWVKQMLQQERRICWRTFQHRVDDSVMFNRSWLDYQVGFGQDEHRNFWMGLDAINKGTKDGFRRVRWEMNLWTGDPYWAENEHFIVAGAGDKYRLDMGPLDTSRSTLGMCNLSDLRSPHNKQFSTYNNDNDVSDINCATRYGSGWWHGNCFYFNPNGIYVNGPTAYSLNLTLAPLSYTWETSSYPFVWQYSMMRFESLFTDFI